MQRTGSTVKYLKNGVVFYTSTQSASGSYVVDTALFTGSGGITDTSIVVGAAASEPVRWTNLVNVSSNGVARNPGSGSWNAGASSSQALVGDGELSFRFSQNSGHPIMVGLNDTDTGTHYAELDCAIYSYTTGAISIWEHGTNMFAGRASSSPSDVFTIRRTGTEIDYLVNGTVIYTSTWS